MKATVSLCVSLMIYCALVAETEQTAELEKENEKANLTLGTLEENAALNNRTAQLVLQNTRLTDELLHLSDQVKSLAIVVEENRQLKENAAKLALEKTTADFNSNQTLTRLEKLDNEHQKCGELKKGLENKTLHMSLEIVNLHANISRLERNAKAHQAHNEELRKLLPVMVNYYKQVNETEEKDREIVVLKARIANMTKTIASFEQNESYLTEQVQSAWNECEVARSETAAIRLQWSEQRQRLTNVTRESEENALNVVHLREELEAYETALKNSKSVIAKLHANELALREQVFNATSTGELLLNQSQLQYEATCLQLANVTVEKELEIDSLRAKIANMSEMMASLEQNESHLSEQVQNAWHECEEAHSETEAIRLQWHEERQRLANCTQRTALLEQDLTELKLESEKDELIWREEVRKLRNACELQVNVTRARDTEIGNYKLELANAVQSLNQSKNECEINHLNCWQLRDELNKHESKLKEKETKIEKLKENDAIYVSSLRDELDKQVNVTRARDIEIGNFKTELTDARQRIAALEEQSETQQKADKERLEALEQELIESQLSNANLTEKLSALEQSNDQQLQNQQMIDKLLNDLHNCEAVKEAVVIELNEMSGELVSLRQEKRQLEMLQSEMLLLSELRQTLEGHNKRLSSEIAKLHLQLKERDAKIETTTTTTTTTTMTTTVPQLTSFDESRVVFVPTSSDFSIQVLDSANKQVLKTFTGHKSAIVAIERLTDTKLVSGSTDGEIRFWSLQDAAANITTLQHDKLTCLQVICASQLASGGGDGKVMIWSLDDGKCVATLAHSPALQPNGPKACCKKKKIGKVPSQPVTSLALFSMNRLASGSSDSTIKIWNLDDSTCLTVLKGHKAAILALQVLSETILASASADTTVKIWNLASSQCVQTLVGHTNQVVALRAISDSQLASASLDKTIKVWNVNDVTCNRTISDLTIQRMPEGLAQNSLELRKID